MRRSITVIPLGLALLVQAAGALAEETVEPAPAAGQGQLVGQVSTPSGTAVSGATVVAYHLSSESVFRSADTDAKGRFKIAALPYGYFDIAVQTGDGLYVADQVVNVPPAGKASLTMTLYAGAADQEAPRGFAGIDQAPSGVARVESKASAGQFWKSAKGVAILGGIGGAALLAIALSSDEDEDEISVSPSTLAD
ncbi:MAG TPA: carboxypeptidase-like regulatory domain-containing protein [Candidatus Polarisedimenticolaceae bacterium]|nr:carboxypeptidase-like regulatory domain-containing protein [Candidatus Polarisedimenticolaceae bacterium]